MSARSRFLRSLLLSCSLATTACASAAGRAPAGEGVPGFDTRDYPGAETMSVWLEESPYRWVGYYLSDAPCYTGTSWRGRRAELERMGWGLAVVFVGEQDWPPVQREPEVATDRQDGPPRCTRTNLTPERALADARAAESTAAADGFQPGTVIYLDVERVESPSSGLLGYVERWAAALLSGGRYVPGLYAHAANATPLREAMERAFEASGRAARPRLWVAAAEGFDLGRSPAEAPVPSADVWQGAFDIPETWGGVTLRIDVNVAARPSPSS